MCKWTKGFELIKLTFLKLFFSFQERKMGPFKTKNCKFLTFPIAICKAVFPKVYFHIQQEIGVMFTEVKVKSLISSLLINKHVRLNSFGTYNKWIRLCHIHSLCGTVDRDTEVHISIFLSYGMCNFIACTE